MTSNIIYGGNGGVNDSSQIGWGVGNGGSNYLIGNLSYEELRQKYCESLIYFSKNLSEANLSIANAEELHRVLAERYALLKAQDENNRYYLKQRENELLFLRHHYQEMQIKFYRQKKLIDQFVHILAKRLSQMNIEVKNVIQTLSKKYSGTPEDLLEDEKKNAASIAAAIAAAAETAASSAKSASSPPDSSKTLLSQSLPLQAPATTAPVNPLILLASTFIRQQQQRQGTTCPIAEHQIQFSSTSEKDAFTLTRSSSASASCLASSSPTAATTAAAAAAANNHSNTTASETSLSLSSTSPKSQQIISSSKSSTSNDENNSGNKTSKCNNNNIHLGGPILDMSNFVGPAVGVSKQQQQQKQQQESLFHSSAATTTSSSSSSSSVNAVPITNSIIESCNNISEVGNVGIVFNTKRSPPHSNIIREQQQHSNNLRDASLRDVPLRAAGVRNYDIAPNSVVFGTSGTSGDNPLADAFAVINSNNPTINNNSNNNHQVLPTSRRRSHLEKHEHHHQLVGGGGGGGGGKGIGGSSRASVSTTSGGGGNVVSVSASAHASSSGGYNNCNGGGGPLGSSSSVLIAHSGSATGHSAAASPSASIGRERRVPHPPSRARQKRDASEVPKAISSSSMALLPPPLTPSNSTGNIAGSISVPTSSSSINRKRSPRKSVAANGISEG